MDNAPIFSSIILIVLCFEIRTASPHVLCRAERENCEKLLEEYGSDNPLIAHLYDNKSNQPKILGKFCLDSRLVSDCVNNLQKVCPSSGLDFPALEGIGNALSTVCAQLKLPGNEHGWSEEISCIASNVTMDKAFHCHSEIHHRLFGNRSHSYLTDSSDKCRYLTEVVRCSEKVALTLCGTRAAHLVDDYGTKLFSPVRRNESCDKGWSEGEILLAVMAVGLVVYVILCMFIAIHKTRPSSRETWIQCGGQCTEMACCICIAFFRICKGMKTRRKPNRPNTCGYEMQRL